ncbi:MAG: SagB/ThcOx family dehydrogenase [Planctomycetes bacterium]|nr:SagB/ThcOx family dehydrogenase [Planctomycetota bacterium]
MAGVINLPEPNKNGPISLEQAIASRRSRRSFLAKPVSLEQIGQLAWAAQGQDTKSKYRTVPSAGATYPLEVFVVTCDGLYHYLAKDHALSQLSYKDLRYELASAAYGQDFIATAPLTLIFAAQFTRTTGYYGKRGIRYVYMEAGHAGQNVSLQAEALGLGSVAVGAFDDDAVSKVLSLPNQLDPLYMLVIGYYQK